MYETKIGLHVVIKPNCNLITKKWCQDKQNEYNTPLFPTNPLLNTHPGAKSVQLSVPTGPTGTYLGFMLSSNDIITLGKVTTSEIKTMVPVVMESNLFTYILTQIRPHNRVDVLGPIL